MAQLKLGTLIGGYTAWHSGNDGADSGLDADLLDGQQSSYYTDITARLGYTPVNKAGDSMSGALSIDNGTLTASIPALNATQTWNNASIPFTAIKVNITDTASNASSLLMDLQVGGVSKFKVDKSGVILADGKFQAVTTSGGGSYLRFYSGTHKYLFEAVVSGDQCLFYDQGLKSLAATSATSFRINADVILARDAANTLAQRNGVNAQTYRLYNTYTDASNYERAKFGWNSNVLEIGTENAGTGTLRNINFVGGNVGIGTSAPSSKLHINTTAINGREAIIKGTVSDDATGAFFVYNGTGNNNKFISAFSGYQDHSNTRESLGFLGLISQANDVSNSSAMGIVNFGASRTSSTSDPINGTFTDVQNRNIFSISHKAGVAVETDTAFIVRSNGTVVFPSGGNVGINTTAPSAKLDIVDTTLSGSGSLAGSALSISQTWNTTGSPTAVKLNITNTASGANSLLMDLQVGGSSKFKVDKSGNQTVVGTVSHSGLVPTEGTAIDQIKSITRQLTLTTDWQDVGINGTDLTTGSYLVQLFANDSSAGGTNINEYYTGNMSWYDGPTVSDTELPTDEIVLHRAGGGGDGALYLRTYRTNNGVLKLQIYSNQPNTSSANYVFKFRRMI